MGGTSGAVVSEWPGLWELERGELTLTQSTQHKLLTLQEQLELDF